MPGGPARACIHTGHYLWKNAVEVGGLVGHIIGPLDCSSGCHTGVAFSACSGSYPVALRKEGGRSATENNM